MSDFQSSNSASSPRPGSIYPLEPAIPHVPGVPHSFGVGVLMILVTMFAVLFAAMRSLDAHPGVFASVAFLFLCVALGQMLLFQGRQPRKASLWVGGVLGPIEAIVLVYIMLHLSRGFGRFSPLEVLLAIVLIAIVSILLGVLQGYCAGTLTAGIFLFLERRQPQAVAEIVPEIELEPAGDDDFTTLAMWLSDPSLLRHWRATYPTFPLDRDSLAARRAETAGAEPSRLMLKAVAQGDHRMLGYLELAGVDRATHVARLELPVIDPAAPQRGELSMRLLRAAIGRAGQLQVARLFARVPANQKPLVRCYRRAGFTWLSNTTASPTGGPTLYLMEIAVPQSHREEASPAAEVRSP
jgi:hypothetical protein